MDLNSNGNILCLWSRRLFRKKLLRHFRNSFKRTVSSVDSFQKEDNIDRLSSFLSSILWHFTSEQLRTLLHVVRHCVSNDGGRILSDCIDCPDRSNDKQQREAIVAFICIGFRWPFLIGDQSLRLARLCSNQNNCVNPFHWCLVKQPQPSPHQCPVSCDNCAQCPLLRDVKCNLRINHTRRTARLITPAVKNLVGLRLLQFQVSESCDSDKIRPPLMKEIGICLHCEDRNSLSVCNYSDQTLFISSMFMDQCDSMVTSLPKVHRLPPDHSIKVFSAEQLHILEHEEILTSLLVNRMGSIQISVAKGWGPGYSRLDFLCCPTRCDITFRL